MAERRKADRPSSARAFLMIHRTGLFIAVWLGLQPCVLAAEITFCPATGAGRFSATVESLLERRWKHVVRQSLDISCGSAALATILKYQFGDKVSEPELIRAILNHVGEKEFRKHGGFSLLDLKGVAAELGYHVEGYKVSLDRLAALKRPALVPIALRGFKHFIVFRGMVGDRVVLADPAFGNTLMERSQFVRIWKGVALVCIKNGTHLPSQLDVTDEDLPVAETDDALRSFINRVDVHSVIGQDEF